MGNVDFAADEPLGKRGLPIEGGVPLLEPVEFFLGEFGPKGGGVGGGAIVQGLIVIQAFNFGISRQIRRRRKGAIFLKDRFDRRL